MGERPVDIDGIKLARAFHERAVKRLAAQGLTLPPFEGLPAEELDTLVRSCRDLLDDGIVTLGPNA